MKLSGLFQVCLAVLVLSSWLFAERSELEKESYRRYANQLLFFFDSDMRVMNQRQIDDLKKEDHTATAKVFLRILEKRKSAKNDREYMNKIQKQEMSGKYMFQSYEIRDAAFEELMLMGKDALDVLLQAVNSSRAAVQQGVLKTLRNYKDDRILGVYHEVMFRDDRGETAFSSMGRQYVAQSVYKYLDNDGGKRIFKKCLFDKDPFVRAMVLESLSHSEKESMSFVVPLLVELTVREKKEVIEAIERLKEREDRIFIKRGSERKMRGFYEILRDKQAILVSYLRGLQALLTYAPEKLSEIDLKPEWWRLSAVGRLLIENEKQLTPEFRKEILSYYLENSSDISLLRRCMQALGDEDKAHFSDRIREILLQSRDAVVMGEAMRLAGVWQLKECHGRLLEISKKDYRSSIRSLALTTAEKLK